MSYAETGRRLSLSKSAVQRAAGVLSKFGLVKASGSRVATNAKTGKHYVAQHRKVFGQPGTDGQSTVTSSFQKYASTRNRGGRRTGSGRPHKGCGIGFDFCSSSESLVFNQTRYHTPPEDNQTRYHEHNFNYSEGLGNMPKTEADKKESNPILQESNPIPIYTSYIDTELITDSNESVKVHGGPMDPRLSSQVLSEPPPFPHDGIVRAYVSLPEAPLVPTSLDDRGRTEWALGALRSYLNAKYPGHRAYLPRGRLERWGALGALQSFVAAVTAHEVPPAAWWAWRAAWWASNAGKAKPKAPPPVKVLLDAAAVAEHRGFFKRQLADGELHDVIPHGRRIDTPLRAELRKRWVEMDRDILLNCRTPEQEAATVMRHFPGDIYWQMVDSARLEAQEQQARLRGEVSAGSWVWG